MKSSCDGFLQWAAWLKILVYVHNLNEVEVETPKSADCTILQGKITKLMDARLLLQSGFFLDMLTEAKCLSMITQEKSISIMNLLDAFETRKSSYECLLKKVKKNLVFIFELASLEPVVD